MATMAPLLMQAELPLSSKNDLHFKLQAPAGESSNHDSSNDDARSIASDTTEDLCDEDFAHFDTSAEEVVTPMCPAGEIDANSIDAELIKAYANRRPADDVDLDENGFILFDDEEEDEDTKKYVQAFEEEVKSTYGDRHMMNRGSVDPELLALVTPSTPTVSAQVPTAARPVFIRRRQSASSTSSPASPPAPVAGLAGAAGRALRRVR